MNGNVSRLTSVDAGLLILRLWVGLVGVLHGSQKLFGAFGGPGLKGFADALAKMNMPAPMAGAIAMACAEFFGGILIAVGILPRLAAIPFAFGMIVAWATAHHYKFFSQGGGGEYALTLAAILIALVVAGPGRYTLAAPFVGRSTPRPARA